MGDELERHDPLTPERVDAVAHQFLTELAQDPNVHYLDQARFKGSVWLWATSMAKAEILRRWVDSMPIEDAANSARGQTSPLELLRKWITTAQGEASRLGLDPLSAARLGKDVAQGRQADAAAELTRLRAIHDAAEDDDE